MRAVGDAIPFDWRLIVNGYLPDYAYEDGALDTRLPLSELRKIGHIDRRARAAEGSPLFSKLIRTGVPSPRDRSPSGGGYRPFAVSGVPVPKAEFGNEGTHERRFAKTARRPAGRADCWRIPLLMHLLDDMFDIRGGPKASRY